MKVTRSADYALDWPTYKTRPEVFIVQSNYNQIKEVCFFAGLDRREVTTIDKHTVALFRITKKIFVNPNGELI